MIAILIIEDDTTISNQIENAINSMEREVRILKSKEGKKALQISKLMEIDIFILDIGLPDCDGITLAKEIRKEYPYQPIIVESSQNDTVYKSNIHDQIENLAFLDKPYSNERLIAKVDHALDIAENLGVKQLKIKQNGFYRVIEIRDILYVEKIKGKKRIKIMLHNRDKNCLAEEEFVGLSLNALLDMLKDQKDLFRCHKGFIINPKMIEKLNYVDNSISLKYTDEEIPIGKTFKKTIDLLL